MIKASSSFSVVDQLLSVCRNGGVSRSSFRLAICGCGVGGKELQRFPSRSIVNASTLFWPPTRTGKPRTLCCCSDNKKLSHTWLMIQQARDVRDRPCGEITHLLCIKQPINCCSFYYARCTLGYRFNNVLRSKLPFSEFQKMIVSRGWVGDTVSFASQEWDALFALR